MDFFLRVPLLKKMFLNLLEIQEAMDTLHSRIDVPDELFIKFQEDRISESYNKIFDHKEPLVTICVPTYNRGNLLLERSLKSLLGQDYQNLEIIVVGDCCTDNTEDLINKIKDERIKFFNLPERGRYPKVPEWHWMVAGTAAVNYALDLANGDFITHLDDDDKHLPERVSKLVQFIQETRSDFVWHPFWRETVTRKWQLKSATYFRKNEVTTSSVFYHKWFKRILWDIDAYKYSEPGDWNRFRKFKYIGANMSRFPEPLLKHFRERSQSQK